LPIARAVGISGRLIRACRERQIMKAAGADGVVRCNRAMVWSRGRQGSPVRSGAARGDRCNRVTASSPVHPGNRDRAVAAHRAIPGGQVYPGGSACPVGRDDPACQDDPAYPAAMAHLDARDDPVAMARLGHGRANGDRAMGDRGSRRCRHTR